MHTPAPIVAMPGFRSGSVAPPVSIGLPVRNGGDFLAAALDSIRNQTYGDFELLISDNASTDDTEQICRDAGADDERIVYDRLPTNVGAAANYNRLVHAARGRWFKWASHDDLLHETTVERLVDHLAADPSPVLAYPKTTLIDEQGAVIRTHEDNLDLRQERPHQRLAELARRWSLCHPVFGLIDRQRLLATSLIGPYIGSDVTLLAELAVLGQFHEIPHRLFYRRIHSASSRQGDLSLDEVAAWFDPSQERAPRLRPSNLVMVKIVQSLRESELSGPDRLRCAFAYCGTWGVRRVRIRGGAVKQRLRRAQYGWAATQQG